jgi:hypothetical protein
MRKEQRSSLLQPLVCGSNEAYYSHCVQTVVGQAVFKSYVGLCFLDYMHMHLWALKLFATHITTLTDPEDLMCEVRNSTFKK